MPQTKRSGKQQKSSVGTGFGNSKSSPNSSSKFKELLDKFVGRKISRSNLRMEVFMLLDDMGAGRGNNIEVGKYYFFEYNPKFRDSLKEWDQYPLIQVVQKDKHILGSNLHYVSPKRRLGVLNNKSIPNETLHYYIPKQKETNFYELDEQDAVLLSQLPLDHFHRNR